MKRSTLPRRTMDRVVESFAPWPERRTRLRVIAASVGHTGQVIVPKQMRPIVAGRQRIQFIYQAPDAGFAKVAGIELMLLDAVRYFHQAAGLNGAAQIVHDLGGKADPRELTKAAALYENSTVRRLGYLLEHFGHRRQASALRPFTRAAKSMKLLDPSVKRIAALGAAANAATEAPSWKLIINAPVEIDA